MTTNKKIEFDDGFCFISRDERLITVCFCDRKCCCKKIDDDYLSFVNDIKDKELKYALYGSKNKLNKRKRRRFI